MKHFLLLVLSIFLLSCASSYKKDADGNYILDKELVAKNLGVVINIPNSWGVSDNNINKSNAFASRNGHGLDRCGISEVSDEIVNNYSNDAIEKLVTAKYTKESSEFLKNKVYESYFENAVLSNNEAYLYILKAQFKHKENNIYFTGSEYFIYTAKRDFKNIMLHCTILGSDKENEFKNLVKEIAKQIEF